MQNKPNLLNAEMNVSYDYRKDYENKRLRRHRKNKPNQTQFEAQSKPIRPNSKPNQTQFLYQKSSLTFQNILCHFRWSAENLGEVVN